MKYTKIHLFSLCCAILFVQLLTACMNEEFHYGRNGETPEQPATKDNVTLQFRLQVSADGGSEDELLDEMDGFTLFIFDGAGGYLSQESVSREFLLAHNNTVTLQMDPGNYRMVCWGNSGTYSMITNLKTGVHISDAAIVHTATQGGKLVVVTDGDPLYFAPRNGNVTRAAAGGSYAFTVPDQGAVTADIDFTMAHKKLHVYVKDFRGTDANGATDCPEINVGALVCGYDFLLQPVEGAQLAYRNRTVQQMDTRSGTICSTAGFNAPLFTYDDQVNIEVINPADEKVRYSLNLIEELKKQNINPADEAIRDIRVDIEFDKTFDAAVSITIPGWNQKPVAPGLN